MARTLRIPIGIIISPSRSASSSTTCSYAPTASVICVAPPPPDPQQPQMERIPADKRRWVVTASAFFMNACQTGTFFFTPTTLMPTITKQFNIPIGLSTLPIAIGKVSYVILLIPGGILVDTVGPRLTCLVGISILAVSMILYISFVNSLALLIMFHIFIAASASISGVPVYSIFIAQWFTSENLGLAMGLVLSGYSAAGTLVPMFLSPISDNFGWRYAMGSMVAIVVFIALPISYSFLHEHHVDEEQLLEQEAQLQLTAGLDPEQDADPEPLEIPTAANIAHSDSTTQLVQTQTVSAQSPPPATEIGPPGFWTFLGFALSYLFLQYCNGCFIENIMFFLTVDRNMSLSMASVFFSTLNLSAFAAKIVGGHLGDRFDRFHVATAASVICAAGIGFLFVGGAGFDEHFIPQLSNYYFSFLVFSMLYGFGYGASFNSLYALVPIVFGRKNLGRIQSMFFGAGLCGNAVGSVLTSILRSRFESYQLAFLVAFISCLGNVVSFRLTRMSLHSTAQAAKDLAASEHIVQDPAIAASYYPGIAALDEEEEAARERLGDASDTTTEPKMSPMVSERSLVDMAALHGSSSVSNMTQGETGMFVTPRTLSFLNTETPDNSSSYVVDGSNNPLMAGHRSSMFYPGTGMVPEGGYPIARDWSSSSLRRNMNSVTDLNVSVLPPASGEASTTAPMNIPGQGMGVRKSSTLEAMIDSGILSASMESVGYLGTKLGINGRSNRQPPVRVPSSASMARGGMFIPRTPPVRVRSSANIAQPPRNEGGPQSYGAVSSFIDRSNPNAQ